MKLFALAVLLHSALAAPASNYANTCQVSCNNPTIQFAVGLFRSVSPKAEKLCSSLLNRSEGPTSTSTSVVTTTIGATVSSGITTATITSGVAITTTTVAHVSTAVKIDTATVTTTSTITSTLTSIQTSVSTTVINDISLTTTTSTSTVYINHFDVGPTAANNAKRGANLRQAYPQCPEELKNIALDVATKACECFLPSPHTKTIIAQSTSTSTSFVTALSTTTQTVPSSTSTLTSTVIVATQVDQTITVTATSLATSTSTVSTTTTSTTTSTSSIISAATATETATVTSQWEKRYEDTGTNARTYNRYTDYINVPDDIRFDRGAANTFCADACASRSACQFYDFIQSDPAYRNEGYTTAYCILDNQADSADYEQYVPFLLYSLAYRRI